MFTGISRSAQDGFNKDDIAPCLIPLPPLKEQSLVVQRVDELMALCDQLEQQTEASLDAHQTLVQALLDTLLKSADAEELEQNWQRLSAHFDLLFTTEQSIDQLKQTILQLAVMGKLIPQYSIDDPASELLKRITVKKTVDSLPNGVPVLKMGDIQGGCVVLGEHKVISPKLEELPNLYLRDCDIL